MLRSFLIVAAVVAAWATASPSQADIISFILQGQAGFGLLPGNETGPIMGTPGTGGILGGITFDTDTNALSIDVGWGSDNGFMDLTGDAIAMHIHGPTLDAAPTSFTQTANVLIGLGGAGFTASASSGGYSNTVTIEDLNVDDLFNGQLYINVHTSLNPNGEIRGNLSPFPKPLC